MRWGTLVKRAGKAGGKAKDAVVTAVVTDAATGRTFRTPLSLKFGPDGSLMLEGEIRVETTRAEGPAETMAHEATYGRLMEWVAENGDSILVKDEPESFRGGNADVVGYKERASDEWTWLASDLVNEQVAKTEPVPLRFYQWAEREGLVERHGSGFRRLCSWLGPDGPATRTCVRIRTAAEGIAGKGNRG